MPFTPYHFGPSVFLGLVFRKYIDVPVFILSNVIVDIEVLYWPRWPLHRVTHTLLFGAAAGIIWGLAAYPLRGFFKKIMRTIRISYETTFLKMVISGILGIWLHTVIDAVYHWDVRLFWPSTARPLYSLVSKSSVRIICIAFFLAAVIPYVMGVRSYLKKQD